MRELFIDCSLGAAGDMISAALLELCPDKAAVLDRLNSFGIPGVVYTNPEVAGVGLTEAEAKDKGIDYKVVKLPMQYSGRFVAENERGEGICKLIVGAKYHEVLGAHMLGNPCSEIIQSMCIAIEQEMPVEQLKEVVFPHPTVGEIIKETVYSFK